MLREGVAPREESSSAAAARARICRRAEAVRARDGAKRCAGDGVNKAAGYFRDIRCKPGEDLLDLATHVDREEIGQVRCVGVHVAMSTRRLTVDLKLRVETGKVEPRSGGGTRPARGSNVIDLMAALKKSLDRPRRARRRDPRPRPPRDRKPAAPRRKRTLTWPRSRSAETYNRKRDFSEHADGDARAPAAICSSSEHDATRLH